MLTINQIKEARDLALKFLLAKNIVRKKRMPILSPKATAIQAYLNEVAGEFDEKYINLCVSMCRITLGEDIKVETVKSIWKKYIVVVPTKGMDGHNYPIGIPAMIDSNSKPLSYMLRIDGSIGNHCFEPAIRKATPDEIKTFCYSLPDKSIEEYFGHLVKKDQEELAEVV